MKSSVGLNKNIFWAAGVVIVGVIVTLYSLFLLLYGSIGGCVADAFRISLASLLLVSGIGILRKKNWSRLATSVLLIALTINWMSYMKTFQQEASFIIIFEIFIITFLFLPGTKKLFK